MNDDTLYHLLHQADASTGAPLPTVSADDLLAAVGRRRRRSAYAKTAAASLIVLAIVTAALWHTRPTSHRPEIASSESLEDVHKTSHHIDFADLEREAQMREQVVRAVLADEKTDNAAIETQTTDDADLVRLEAARSAALSWRYATFVETDMNDPKAARREYQRVADRFPGTTWAALATTSLERLADPTSPPSL